MPARLLLAVMILGVCLCMAYRLVVPPANPYSITVERQR